MSAFDDMKADLLGSELDQLDEEQQLAMEQLLDYSAKLEERSTKSAVFHELLKSFNRNSYYLRAGLLGKQYLQGVPSFRKQMELDLKLADLYDECGGEPSALLVDSVISFIKDYLVPSFSPAGVLKVQRTNRKWSKAYDRLTSEEKAQLSLSWRALATIHIRSLPIALTEDQVVMDITTRLVGITKTALTPQAIVSWIGKEDKVTQATGIKDYGVAYLSLCFSLYSELGEWDSLASYFDPRGEAEAEHFSELDKEIADFAGLLSADGLLDEL